MQKMQIWLNEAKIKREGVYTVEEVWKVVDEAFEEGKCIKEVQTDGSIMYSGNPNSNNYLSDFGVAYVMLIDDELFIRYALDWKWFSNEENRAGTYIEMNPMQDLIKEWGDNRN